MARHTITIEELDDWLRKPQWQTVASSFGEGSNKGLEMDTGSDGHVFRVFDRGETKFLGTDKAAAIAEYNAAP